MGLLDKQFDDGNIVITSVEGVLNWARLCSLWQMSFGLACCAIEMMAASASHNDIMRFGVLPRPSPRQCDVMIVAGTVALKMATRLKRLYDGYIPGCPPRPEALLEGWMRLQDKVRDFTLVKEKGEAVGERA